MKDLPLRAISWCPYCNWSMNIKVLQPYQDYTYRVEFHCRNYDCDEHGIVMLMEVKE